MSKFTYRSRPIYLDYNATSPVDHRVVEAMLPYFSEHFGNPASGGHQWGWDADAALQKARAQVARFLGASNFEVVFTSGATESNNWTIKGLVEIWKKEHPDLVPEIISSPIEHPSVLKSLEWAQAQGCKVLWTPVQKDGVVRTQDVRELISANTRLISIMWVHNELGSVNPIDEIGRLAHEHQILLHSDATQAVGKFKIDFSNTAVDLLSFSAHKFFGPKGIGALLIRQRNPKVKLQPLLLGGGHERGQRSGTPNVPLIVGLGKVCELLQEESSQQQDIYRRKLKKFWEDLQVQNPGVELNGPELKSRSPNNLNITFTQNQVPTAIPGLGISHGSACSSSKEDLSPTLKAIGRTPEEIRNTLRVSIGPATTDEELAQTLEIFGQFPKTHAAPRS